MQPPSALESARWQRLLSACRHGLNHDMANQVIALQGLLQLLEEAEAQRLSADGQEFLMRLMERARTFKPTRMPGDLARLATPRPRRTWWPCRN